MISTLRKPLSVPQPASSELRLKADLEPITPRVQVDPTLVDVDERDEAPSTERTPGPPDGCWTEAPATKRNPLNLAWS